MVMLSDERFDYIAVNYSAEVAAQVKLLQMTLDGLVTRLSNVQTIGQRLIVDHAVESVAIRANHLLTILQNKF